jgi:hypothetical protein
MPFRHISVLDRELARGIWIEFDSMGIDTDRKMHGAFAKTRVTGWRIYERSHYAQRSIIRIILRVLGTSERCRCASESISRSTQKLAKGNVQICPVIGDAIFDALPRSGTLQMTGKVRRQKLNRLLHRECISTSSDSVRRRRSKYQ